MTSQLAAEAKWLRDNPQFRERPASIREFIGADYLDMETEIRPGILEVLVKIFGEELDPSSISPNRKVALTGSVGYGKSTAASIILVYCVHWVQCLKNPQGFFGLAKGSRIAFMLMSTSERQAREVLFGDVKARVNNSPWFQRFCKYDEKHKNQLRFPRDIWIVPGGSEETRYEGYNVLAGIIDEADSHRKTDLKDYAEQGLDTIHSRIVSRFPDYENDSHRGLICVIGQMKSATGFMNKIYNEWLEDSDAVTHRMMLWEALGWHKFTKNPADITSGRETAERKSFVYDINRKKVINTREAREDGIDFSTPDSGYVEVPTTYLDQFKRDPVKALRDLAGIPPEASDPFFALPQRILTCQQLWHEMNGESPRAGDETHWPTLHLPKAENQIKRVVHLDIAIAAAGDALGFAMGHVAGIVDVDGEEKPLIVFDLLLRIHAASGSEIILSDVRRIIYSLVRDYDYNIRLVTADGFSSQDTMQQMRKQHIASDYISVDRTKQPYEDLREGIYDERVLFPKYMAKLREGDTEAVNVPYKELSQLSDTGMKIDHPSAAAGGSKDVADAMAGVVHVLMSQTQFRRGSPIIAHPNPNRAPDEVRTQNLAAENEETIGEAAYGAGKGSSLPVFAGGPADSSFTDWVARYSPHLSDRAPDTGHRSVPIIDLGYR